MRVLPTGADTIIDARTTSTPVIVSDTVIFAVGDYGAAGDGTTDDTDAIQDAIDACFAASGGTVWFPAGTYKLTEPLILKAQVRLIGESQRNTILTQTGTGAVIAVDTAAPSSVWGNEIAFLSLRGNLTDTSTGDGIASVDTAYGFEDAWMHDIFIQGAGRDGLHFEQTGISTLGDWNQYLRIERVYMRDLNWDGHTSGIARYGIYGYGAFSTNSIRNCKLYYCGQGGIHIEQNSNGVAAVSNLIDTNVVQATGNGDVVAHGVYIKGAHATTMTNNYCEDIGLADTSAVSAAVCIDGTNTRSVNIIGHFSSKCHEHIRLAYGTGVFIDGATFGWNGSSPAASTAIHILSTFKAHSLRIGAMCFNAGTSSDDMTWITNDSTGKPHGLLNWVASDSQTDGNFYVRRLNVNGASSITSGTSAPASGTFVTGDYCVNSAPAAGEAFGWVCTSGGSPGTWVVAGTLPKTAAPSAGAYTAGDVVYNSAPSAGQPMGWICTVAGTPGTWVPLANVPA